ncbi:MAG: hypothetical protein ACR2J8_05085, partial [Thermomicrobiales bacterium]
PAYLGSLATSDASFTLLIAIATLAAARLAQRPSLLRALALWLALGLGAGNKLSPLLASMPLGALGLWLLFSDAVPRRDMPRDRLGWMLTITPLATTLIFLGCYPYFWPDPIDRTRNLFAFRVREMQAQAADWPTMAEPSRLEALRRVALNFTQRYSILGSVGSALEPALGRRPAFPPLELLAALTGVAIWWRTAFTRGLRSPAVLAFVTLGGQVAVTILGMRSEFDRYHAPMALMGAIAFGVLTGWLTPRISTRLSRRSSSRDHSSTVAA